MKKIKLKKCTQQKSYTCGPVCLQMIALYFGKNCQREKIISLCKASKLRGTSHNNIIKAARKLGFKVSFKNKASIDDIIYWLRQDVPVLVNYCEFITNKGHYGVICGYEGDTLIINDPEMSKNIKVDMRRFLKYWHNHLNTSQRWFMVMLKK